MSNGGRWTFRFLVRENLWEEATFQLRHERHESISQESECVGMGTAGGGDILVKGSMWEGLEARKILKWN